MIIMQHELLKLQRKTQWKNLLVTNKQSTHFKLKFEFIYMQQLTVAVTDLTLLGDTDLNLRCWNLPNVGTCYRKNSEGIFSILLESRKSRRAAKRRYGKREEREEEFSRRFFLSLLGERKPLGPGSVMKTEFNLRYMITRKGQ